MRPHKEKANTEVSSSIPQYTERIPSNVKNGRYKTDWLGLIILACMLFGAVVICIYLITEKIHACTSNPLMYILKDNSKTDNINYTYIRAYIFLNEYDDIPSRILELDLNLARQDYEKQTNPYPLPN